MNPDNTVAPEAFPCKIGYIDGMTVHEGQYVNSEPVQDRVSGPDRRIRFGNNRYHVPREVAQKKRKARRKAQSLQRKKSQ